MTQMCCFSGICLICLETLNKNENEIHLHSFCLMKTCWLVVASTLWKLTLELSQPWCQVHFCVIYGMPSFSVLKFRTSNVCPQHLSRYTKILEMNSLRRELGLWAHIPLLSNLLYPSGLHFPLSNIFSVTFQNENCSSWPKRWKQNQIWKISFCYPSISHSCWLIFVNTEVSWDNNYSKTFLITGFWSRNCPLVWEGESTLT